VNVKPYCASPGERRTSNSEQPHLITCLYTCVFDYHLLSWPKSDNVPHLGLYMPLCLTRPISSPLNVCKNTAICFLAHHDAAQTPQPETPNIHPACPSVFQIQKFTDSYGHGPALATRCRCFVLAPRPVSRNASSCFRDPRQIRSRPSCCRDCSTASAG
jgi:hypothetical protein